MYSRKNVDCEQLERALRTVLRELDLPLHFEVTRGRRKGFRVFIPEQRVLSKMLAPMVIRGCSDARVLRATIARFTEMKIKLAEPRLHQVSLEVTCFRVGTRVRIHEQVLLMGAIKQTQIRARQPHLAVKKVVSTMKGVFKALEAEAEAKARARARERFFK